MKTIFLIVSLVFNLIALVAFFVVTQKFGGPVYLFLKLQKVPNGVEFEDRKSHFQSLPDKTGEIIFFGNSITARGNWNELFDERCINRGVGGDDVYRLLDRVDEVTTRKPAKVFIEIGINDLSKRRNVLNFIDTYERLILRIRKDSPSTRIYIQSILPVNNAIKYNFRENTEIREVNAALKILASKLDVAYIDLFDAFLGEDGELDESLTTDGVHINGNGYVRWKQMIESYVMTDQE